MKLRRRTMIASVAAGAVALGGAVGGGWLVRDVGSGTTTLTSATVRTGTGTVEKGDLSGRTTRQGVVEGTPGGPVTTGLSGTLTSVRGTGTTVAPRDVLYRVDNVPVVFFSGRLPQWRAFEAGMSAGPDIRQLEENLVAWGYLDAADDRFDWRTREAIRTWQREVGQEVTGAIPLGGLWFGVGERVVTSVSAGVGAAVAPGAEILTTSGRDVVVTVDLPVGSPLATRGGHVDVTLPDGTRVGGTVTSVGSPETAEDGTTTAPAVITLKSQGKAKGLHKVTVSVDFVTETRKDVLSVPVLALGAASGGGFTVEVAGRDGKSTTVPVKVGLFAGDRVEIVSGDLRVGQNVVVPV